MTLVINKKSKYLESLSQQKEIFSTTELAKGYGMSARAMNKILVEMDILKKVGNNYAIVEIWRDPVYFRHIIIEIYYNNQRLFSPR
jgi:hypothetical protein